MFQPGIIDAIPFFMKIDFSEQFRNYSTVELLLITKHPDKYQPEAVAAAAGLLASRNIGEEEAAAVAAYQESAIDSNNPVDKLQSEAGDLLKPFLTKGEKATPEQWYKLLLVLWTIQLAFTAYNTISYLIGFSQLQIKFIPFGTYLYLAGAAFNTAIYVLLFKRMRMGWILFFVFNLLGIGNDLLRLWLKNNYNNIDFTSVLIDLVLLIIHAGVAVVMWQQNIAALFEVSKAEKKYTFVAAGVLMALMFTYGIVSAY